MHIDDWSDAFLSRFSSEAYAENLALAHINMTMLNLKSKKSVQTDKKQSRNATTTFKTLKHRLHKQKKQKKLKQQLKRMSLSKA